MPQENDNELTLPSVVRPSNARSKPEKPLVVIVFHPDTRRIGQHAVLPIGGRRGSMVLGRLEPDFHWDNEKEGVPLGEPHISRSALHLAQDGGGLLIQRPEGASRSRVLGRELDSSVRLTAEQLRKGVPLLLSHSVVLLLRLTGSAPQVEPDTKEFGLWGSSRYMVALRGQVRRLADREEDVLIRGETGTGKELVAAAIHANSRRAGRPLVTVNTAAIPSELAAVALFGASKGAYTGSERASQGYFQQAEGGCLFLDEVGDMPMAIQPQMLRALQQREVQQVGGAISHVDVRVISATDAPLEGEGSDFKAALRHRLGALEVHLLPLRDHLEDVGELALKTLRGCFAGRSAECLLPSGSSSDLEIAAWADFFHLLLLHEWPGNVRELINVCRQVAAVSDRQLTLPESLRALLSQSQQDQHQTRGRDKFRAMSTVAKVELDRAWHESGYEPTGAARLLGVSRPAFYRRIEGDAAYRLASQVEPAELASVLLACEGDSVRTAAELRVSLSALRGRLRNEQLDWF